MVISACEPDTAPGSMGDEGQHAGWAADDQPAPIYHAGAHASQAWTCTAHIFRRGSGKAKDYVYPDWARLRGATKEECEEKRVQWISEQLHQKVPRRKRPRTPSPICPPRTDSASAEAIPTEASDLDKAVQPAGRILRTRPPAAPTPARRTRPAGPGRSHRKECGRSNDENQPSLPADPNITHPGGRQLNWLELQGLRSLKEEWRTGNC